jgi:Ala-tRNA(Pro) deacylase
MLRTPEELLSILSEIGINYANHTHPAVFTVDQAALHSEGIEGVHSKNLFLKDKKKSLFLVVTLADKPIIIKELAKKSGPKALRSENPTCSWKLWELRLALSHPLPRSI